MNEDWIGTQEAAGIVGVTRAVVAKYCSGSTVQHLRCRKQGGQWFVSSIDARRLRKELETLGYPGRDSLAGKQRS